MAPIIGPASQVRPLPAEVTMEAKWLEDFLCLAETRSFSRSAEVRHLTQSAFSRRIRALESWLGAELVDRSTYPARLTPAGEMFRAEADAMLKRINDSRAMVRGERASSANTVQFALPHALALTYFPRWLSDVVRGFGPLSTRLVAGNVHDAVVDLVEGHSDLLLCYHHPHHPVELDPARYPMLELGAEAMLPYSATTRSGAPRFRLPGTREAPVPYLAYAPGAFLGRMVESILQAAPERCWLDRRYQTDMAEALKAMTIEGHGIAWLPDSTVTRELREGGLALAARPSTATAWRGEMAIRLYRDAERTRPIVAALWKYLENAARYDR
jgi:LysR family transcriptional regulator, hypochlorite-specific transcription factor HypT